VGRAGEQAVDESDLVAQGGAAAAHCPPLRCACSKRETNPHHFRAVSPTDS